MHRSGVDFLVAEVFVVIDHLVRVHRLHLIVHHSLVVHHLLIVHHSTAHVAGLRLDRSAWISIPSGCSHLVLIVLRLL